MEEMNPNLAINNHYLFGQGEDDEEDDDYYGEKEDGEGQIIKQTMLQGEQSIVNDRRHEEAKNEIVEDRSSFISVE